MTDRSLDIVLFGATGFTGRLVAMYLAGRRDSTLRWALAGRNAAKLSEMRLHLTTIDPALKSLELIVADASDATALASIAARTRVVCTTVGPYQRYGAPLVAACVEAGTDYCDLTGEVAFVRAMIDAHHTRAQSTGARIVNACGFDSIPSDLGVLALYDRMLGDSKQLARARLLVTMKGGISGGTAGSMLDAMAAARSDAGYRKLMADPYALCPEPSTDRRSDQRDNPGVSYDADAGVWTAPFVMAAVNTRIVRRSNVLLGNAYGTGFAYDEVMSMGRGPKGMVMAAGFAAGLAGFVGLALFDFSRPLLAKVLPSSGEGPTEKQRTNGFFKAQIYGTVEGQSRPGYVCTVEGRGDPGYAATSRMLAESALELVATHPTRGPGGIHTPASALGMPLIERLNATDVKFSVTTR